MPEAYFPLVLSHFLLALFSDSFGVLPSAVTDFLPSDILVLECPPKLKILSKIKLSSLVLELIAESIPPLTGLTGSRLPPLFPLPIIRRLRQLPHGRRPVGLL